MIHISYLDYVIYIYTYYTMKLNYIGCFQPPCLDLFGGSLVLPPKGRSFVFLDNQIINI